MMMLLMYCLFGCAICMYFRLWVCNTVIGTVTVDGWTGTARQGTGRGVGLQFVQVRLEVGPGCLPLLGCYVSM